MNRAGLENYPDRLALSRALTNEMQNRNKVYLNLKDDSADYKSLYGERNPETEGKGGDIFEHMLADYKVKYHLKRTSRSVGKGGLRLLKRANTKLLNREVS